MSDKRLEERIYAALLRLYPPAFRNRFGEEALELFRDRGRDERGFLRRIRFWADLFCDLAISLPRQRRAAAGMQSGSLAYSGDGLSFRLLDPESLGAEALLLGGAMSAAAFVLCWILMSHYISYRPVGDMSGEAPGYTDSSGQTGEKTPAAPNRHRQPAALAHTGLLDKSERRRVVASVASNLEQYYIDPALARKMAVALVTREQAGGYDRVTDGNMFATLLTNGMRDISHDMNLVVIFSSAVLPQPSSGPPPEAVARYRAAMQRQNCTFRTVEILPHNIGYLKLDSFPDPSVCESVARAAMARLNGADALIFDLRDNRGGYSDMVALIASYLFDHPEYWFNPRENTTERSWTRSPVTGSKLADKPVFVLISNRTFSGAEHFSYNLKMLNRATLVGETTAGAAHAGVFHRIDDHFGMGITEVKAVNPYAIKSWEGTGVTPDVKVDAANALSVAEKLAGQEVAARDMPAPR